MLSFLVSLVFNKSFLFNVFTFLVLSSLRVGRYFFLIGRYLARASCLVINIHQTLSFSAFWLNCKVCYFVDLHFALICLLMYTKVSP